MRIESTQTRIEKPRLAKPPQGDTSLCLCSGKCNAEPFRKLCSIFGKKIKQKIYAKSELILLTTRRGGRGDGQEETRDELVNDRRELAKVNFTYSEGSVSDSFAYLVSILS